MQHEDEGRADVRELDLTEIEQVSGGAVVAGEVKFVPLKSGGVYIYIDLGGGQYYLP